MNGNNPNLVPDLNLVMEGRVVQNRVFIKNLVDMNVRVLENCALAWCSADANSPLLHRQALGPNIQNGPL